MSGLASARLRHALLLATSGHAGFDPVAAVVILKDILAVPATLPPAERALAMVELQRITNGADLSSENQRLRQQLDDPPAEKAPAACHQSLHVVAPAAASRPTGLRSHSAAAASSASGESDAPVPGRSPPPRARAATYPS